MGASQAHPYKANLKYFVITENGTWFVVTSSKHKKLLNIVV
jgi:hypothetical protein